MGCGRHQRQEAGRAPLSCAGSGCRVSAAGSGLQGVAGVSLRLAAALRGAQPGTSPPASPGSASARRRQLHAQRVAGRHAGEQRVATRECVAGCWLLGGRHRPARARQHGPLATLAAGRAACQTNQAGALTAGELLVDEGGVVALLASGRRGGNRLLRRGQAEGESEH